MTSPRRILARRIEHAGHVYTLAIAEISHHSDGLWRVSIEPFTHETPGTVYHPGTLRICNPTDPSQPFFDSAFEPKLIFK